MAVLNNNSISAINSKIQNSTISGFMGNRRDDEENFAIKALNNSLFKKLKMMGGIGKMVSTNPDVLGNVGLTGSMLGAEALSEQNEIDQVNEYMQAGLGGLMLPSLLATSGKTVAKDIQTAKKRESIAKTEGKLSNADRGDALLKSMSKVGSLGMTGYALNNLATPMGYGSEAFGDISKSMMYSNPMMMGGKLAAGAMDTVGMTDALSGVTGMDPSMIGMLGMGLGMKLANSAMQSLSASTSMNQNKNIRKLPINIQRKPAIQIAQQKSIRPLIMSQLNSIKPEEMSPQINLMMSQLQMMTSISESVSIIPDIYDIIDQKHQEIDKIGGNKTTNWVSENMDTVGRGTADQLRDQNELGVFDKSVLGIERFATNLSLLNPITLLSASLRGESGASLWNENNRSDIFMDPLRAEKDMGQELGLTTQSVINMHRSASDVMSENESYESKMLALTAGIYSLTQEQLQEMITIRTAGFGIDKQSTLGVLDASKSKYEMLEQEANFENNRTGLKFLDNPETYFEMMGNSFVSAMENGLGKIPLVGGLYSVLSNSMKMGVKSFQFGKEKLDNFNSNGDSTWEKLVSTKDKLKDNISEMVFEGLINPLIKDENQLREEIGDTVKSEQELANSYLGHLFPDDIQTSINYLEEIAYNTSEISSSLGGTSYVNQNLSTKWDKRTGTRLTDKEILENEISIAEKFDDQMRAMDPDMDNSWSGMIKRNLFFNDEEKNNEEVNRISEERYAHIREMKESYNIDRLTESYAEASDKDEKEKRSNNINWREYNPNKNKSTINGDLSDQVLLLSYKIDILSESIFKLAEATECNFCEMFKQAFDLNSKPKELEYKKDLLELPNHDTIDADSIENKITMMDGTKYDSTNSTNNTNNTNNTDNTDNNNTKNHNILDNDSIENKITMMDGTKYSENHVNNNNYTNNDNNDNDGISARQNIPKYFEELKVIEEPVNSNYEYETTELTGTDNYSINNLRQNFSDYNPNLKPGTGFTNVPIIEKQSSVVNNEEINNSSMSSLSSMSSMDMLRDEYDAQSEIETDNQRDENRNTTLDEIRDLIKDGVLNVESYAKRENNKPDEGFGLVDMIIAGILGGALLVKDKIINAFKWSFSKIGSILKNSFKFIVGGLLRKLGKLPRIGKIIVGLMGAGFVTDLMADDGNNEGNQNDTNDSDSDNSIVSDIALSLGTMYAGDKMIDKLFGSKETVDKVGGVSDNKNKTNKVKAEIPKQNNIWSKAKKFGGKALDLVPDKIKSFITKKIPFVGTGLSVSSAIKNFKNGNYLSAASDVIGLIPTPHTLALSAALAGGSMYFGEDEKEVILNSENTKNSTNSLNEINSLNSENINISTNSLNEEINSIKHDNNKYTENLDKKRKQEIIEKISINDEFKNIKNSKNEVSKVEKLGKDLEEIKVLLGSLIETTSAGAQAGNINAHLTQAVVVNTQPEPYNHLSQFKYTFDDSNR